MGKASPLARLIATVALLLVIQAVAVKVWGTQPPFVPLLLPSQLWHLSSSIVINASYVWLLRSLFGSPPADLVRRYTRVGWVTTAVSQNQRGAAALGISPEFVSTATWTLGAALAGAAGVLFTPITQVTINGVSLLVIPALAAVLLGGFESFPATLVSGLFVGMAQSVVSNYQNFFEQHLNVNQASDGFPLLLIVVVLLVRGSSLPLRGHVSSGCRRWQRPHPLGGRSARDRRRARADLHGLLEERALRTDGDVHRRDHPAVARRADGLRGPGLARAYALAGIGGLISARLASDAGFGFVPALVVGIVGAVIVGLVFAVPALRTRGVNLAVVTLAFGWATADMLFNNPHASGETQGIVVGRAKLFGWNISAPEHPARYAAFTFVLFVACAILVANLRRGGSGAA